MAHPLSEVPGGGGQHQVDLIAREAFEEAAQEAVLVFEMADDRLDGGAAAEPGPHPRRLRFALSIGWAVGREDFGPLDPSAAAIAAIHDGFGRPATLHGLGHLQDLRQRN